jgi:hypothetical protein
MKKTIFLLLLYFLAFFSSFAQDFEEGKLVMKDGSELTGWISMTYWYKTPDKVSFKNSTEDKIVEYGVEDVSMIQTGNILFKSAKVETELTKNTREHLLEESAFNIDTVEVFLQIIYEGNRGLSFYRNRADQNSYYINIDGQYQLLLFKKYLSIVNDTERVVSRNNFIGQLTLYMNDCESIVKHLSNLEYKQSDLTTLFENYYECTGTERVKESKVVVNPPKLDLGVLAGLTIRNIETIKSNNWDTSINPAMGFYLDLFFRKENRLSFYNEFIYNKFSSTSSRSVVVAQPFLDTLTEISELSYDDIRISSGLKYYLPFKKQEQVFILVALTHSFKQGLTNTSVRYDKDGEFDSPGEIIPDIPNLERGVVIGIGYGYQKFAAEGRVEFGNNFSNGITRGGEDFTTSSIRYYFLLKYKLL